MQAFRTLWSRVNSTGGQILLTVAALLLLACVVHYYRAQVPNLPASETTRVGQKARQYNGTLADFARRLTQ
ncbi:MAG: hypothetical protein V4671_22960 [Armatimonadota bacterium]